MSVLDPLAFPTETPARVARAELLSHVLRRGRVVTDDAFDEIYPSVIRRASSVHWTPLRVAARVIELLDLEEGERLLDVGAGAGKFCIVAAAMSRARVCGVERRPELVEVAREAARRMKVEVELLEGSFDPTLAQDFNALYFFNPFALPVPLSDAPIYSAERYEGHAAKDVELAEEFFGHARRGTRIATFCGFGGAVPVGYERRAHERWDGGWLELWHKTA